MIEALLGVRRPDGVRVREGSAAPLGAWSHPPRNDGARLTGAAQCHERSEPAHNEKDSIGAEDPQRPASR